VNPYPQCKCYTKAYAINDKMKTVFLMQALRKNFAFIKRQKGIEASEQRRDEEIFPYLRLWDATL
jgi:hypothetical protein